MEERVRGIRGESPLLIPVELENRLVERDATPSLGEPLHGEEEAAYILRVSRNPDGSSRAERLILL